MPSRPTRVRARSSAGRLGGPVTGRLSGLATGLVDLVLPRRCVQCGRSGAWLCEACCAELTPLAGPACFRCGRPGSLPTLHCLECEGRELAFVTAAAAFAYSGPARELVRACKFRGLRSLAAEMAALALPRFSDAVSAAAAHGHALHAATWAPTTRERRLERGFDHAELFARELAGRADLPVMELLTRAGAAGHQSRLGRVDRAVNVAGAFALRAAAARELAGPAAGAGSPSCATGSSSQIAIDVGLKRVIIIDDVYTTGETLDQCARAFAGAAYEVHAFTFARTVRGQRC
jgi:predicted amidophosphoribosyltransferase